MTVYNQDPATRGQVRNVLKTIPELQAAVPRRRVPVQHAPGQCHRLRWPHHRQQLRRPGRRRPEQPERPHQQPGRHRLRRAVPDSRRLQLPAAGRRPALGLASRGVRPAADAHLRRDDGAGAGPDAGDAERAGGRARRVPLSVGEPARSAVRQVVPVRQHAFEPTSISSTCSTTTPSPTPCRRSARRSAGRRRSSWGGCSGSAAGSRSRPQIGHRLDADKHGYCSRARTDMTRLRTPLRCSRPRGCARVRRRRRLRTGQTVTIRAARVLDGKGGALTNADRRSEGRHHRQGGSAHRPRHLRPRRRDAAAGHDRRARPHRLSLRQGRPCPEPGRNTRGDGAVRGRERVGDADERLHHGAERRRGERQGAPRCDPARGAAGPAHPDLARVDERADRRAGRSCATTSASRRRRVRTSSRSSPRRASATAARRR